MPESERRNTNAADVHDDEAVDGQVLEPGNQAFRTLAAHGEAGRRKSAHVMVPTEIARPSRWMAFGGREGELVFAEVDA